MKIIILRFSSLGDILLTTPALTLIRNQYPTAEIIYVTKKKFAGALFLNNNINRVITLDKQSLKELAKEIQENSKDKIDLIIDFHNNLRTHLLTFLLKSNKIIRYKKPYLKRWLLVFFKINLFTNIKPVAWQYMQILVKIGIKPIFTKINIHTEAYPIVSNTNSFIAIAPGATWFTKAWPVDNFLEVVKKILDNTDATVVFLGGETEKPLRDLIQQFITMYKYNERVLNFIGDLTLHQTADVISKSKILLTNDSGLMHIAASFNTKIVALFLSTVPEFGFTPFCESNQFTIISSSLKCKPCNHKGLPKCPTKKFLCATNIKIDVVYTKIYEYYTNL